MDLSTCSSFRCTCLEANPQVHHSGLQYGGGAALVGHLCIFFSGYGNYNTATEAVFIFDTKKILWKKVRIKRQQSCFGKMKVQFLANDILYALNWQGPAACVLLTLDLIHMDHWTVIDTKDVPMISSGSGACFVERRNEVILWGGRIGPFKPVVYELKRNAWTFPTTTGKMPPNRQNHALCSTGTFVFIVGGRSALNTHLDLHMLNVEAKPFVWSTPTIEGYVPKPGYQFQAVCTDQRIFVYGGATRASEFDVFCIKTQRWYERVDTEPKEGQFRFYPDWKIGNYEYAAVNSSEKIWIFGGNKVPVQYPLEIVPVL